MKRLRLSILCALVVLALGLGSYLVLAKGQHAHSSNVTNAVVANNQQQKERDRDRDDDDDDVKKNATVSFGSWMTTPPLDRFPNLSPPAANHHELIPQIAKIKAGGTVNFIISGLHLVLVYDDGTQPSDIDTSLLILPPPAGPPLINDPNRRIYRGLDPRALAPTVDRVEVVHFANPGKYLVMCGVLPHFQQGMFGFVKVSR